MSRIPVNMSSPELDVCPVCKALIYKAEGAWLDIFLPDHADTDAPHKHQPKGTIVHAHDHKHDTGRHSHAHTHVRGSESHEHEHAQPGQGA